MMEMNVDTDLHKMEFCQVKEDLLLRKSLYEKVKQLREINKILNNLPEDKERGI